MATLDGPRPGTIFGGDFRVIEPLARGGMGMVYRAEQLSTGRLRALKLLGPLAEGERARERFVHEARIGSRIESEHVVEVIAAGVDGSQQRPWLAMELLEGADLRTLSRDRGGIPRPHAREVMRQLVHGLAAAHRAGIVHRDLKPQNVFVARSRRSDVPFTVKLLDFGIAKILHEGRPAASTTSVVGTPLWMAPEQLERGPLSPRTDIWALGLLVFWTLTGQHYWETAKDPEAPMQALLTEILLSTLTPASERARAVGGLDLSLPGLDGWMRRCIVRTPQSRFADASEAGPDLDRVLAAIPEPDSDLLSVPSSTAAASEPGSPPDPRSSGHDTEPARTMAATDRSLYRDHFFHLVRSEHDILHMIRSDARAGDIDAYLRAVDDLIAVLRVEASRATGLLVDFRRVPPRNDEEFEDATRKHRRVLRTELGRVAFLVRDMAARLQIQRLDRSLSAATPVFTDEATAIAYLVRNDPTDPG